MISEPHTSAVHHRGASVHDTVLGREIIHAATCQKTVSKCTVSQGKIRAGKVKVLTSVSGRENSDVSLLGLRSI
jgi:hypothetical protein